MRPVSRESRFATRICQPYFARSARLACAIDVPSVTRRAVASRHSPRVSPRALDGATHARDERREQDQRECAGEPERPQPVAGGVGQAGCARHDDGHEREQQRHLGAQPQRADRLVQDERRRAHRAARARLRAVTTSFAIRSSSCGVGFAAPPSSEATADSTEPAKNVSSRCRTAERRSVSAGAVGV